MLSLTAITPKAYKRQSSTSMDYGNIIEEALAQLGRRLDVTFGKSYTSGRVITRKGLRNAIWWLVLLSSPKSGRGKRRS